jgi:hypothetical protein
MQQLESYYAQRLLAILGGMNSTVMCWEELFDNGLKLTTGTIVNVWRGGWEYVVHNPLRVTASHSFRCSQPCSCSVPHDLAQVMFAQRMVLSALRCVR